MVNIYEEDTYAQANPTWHEEDSPWKAGQIVRMIKRHRLAPDSIAEVGCGAGEILRILHDRLPGEAEFHGYDIAPASYAMARKKECDRLHFHLVDLFAAEQVFDLLLVIDVVEHVPDYLTFLEKCRHRATWKIYHIPLEIHASAVLRGTVTRAREEVGHIHYFTAESALASLKDTGHEVVDHFYTPGALDLAALHPSFERRLANLPRRLVGMVSEKMSERLFGGYSLLVLAK